MQVPCEVRLQAAQASHHVRIRLPGAQARDSSQCQEKEEGRKERKKRKEGERKRQRKKQKEERRKKARKKRKKETKKEKRERKKERQRARKPSSTQNKEEEDEVDAASKKTCRALDESQKANFWRLIASSKASVCCPHAHARHEMSPVPLAILVGVSIQTNLYYPTFTSRTMSHPTFHRILRAGCCNVRIPSPSFSGGCHCHESWT